MTRRFFLATTSMVGLLSVVKAEEISAEQKRLERVWHTIAAVQNHMFPEGSLLPSAQAMKATAFLKKTILHPTYDRDIRAFVIEGAESLEKRTKGRFVKMDQKEREKALRSYEETHSGASWLARIMNLSMEALFSDPVYGSNINESGWRSVDAFGGQPRPSERYLGR